MKRNISIIKFLLFICLMPVQCYLFGAAAPIITPEAERKQLQEAIRRSLESKTGGVKEVDLGIIMKSLRGGAGVAKDADLTALGLEPVDIGFVNDIHAFIRVLDEKRVELGQNWQQYSQCQINTLRENIKLYIARIHELTNMNNKNATNAAGILRLGVAGLLAALSSNKVFFSGNLCDYMLALNGVQVGDNKLISERKLPSGLTLLYPVSSYQIAHSCGYHALANAFAIGSLLNEKKVLTSQEIRQRAENIIINSMIPLYSEDVCMAINFDVLMQTAGALSPVEGVTLNNDNLFILNANPQESSIFAEQALLEGGLDAIKRALKNTMLEPSSPTFFSIFWNNHWTLAAVIKNSQGDLQIIYLDSRNPFQVAPEIRLALEQLDNIIWEVSKVANVTVAAEAGRAMAPTPEPGVRPRPAIAGGAAVPTGPGVVPAGERSPVDELKELLDFVNVMITSRVTKLEQYKQNPPLGDQKNAALAELERMKNDIALYQRDIAHVLARVLAGEGGAAVREGEGIGKGKGPADGAGRASGAPIDQPVAGQRIIQEIKNVKTWQDLANQINRLIVRNKTLILIDVDLTVGVKVAMGKDERGLSIDLLIPIEKASDVIRGWQDAGAIVLALTARSYGGNSERAAVDPTEGDNTLLVLRLIGIDYGTPVEALGLQNFNDLMDQATRQLRNASYHRGIIYVGHFMGDKGKALEKFLEKNAAQLASIERIIFIDDSNEQIQAIKQYLERVPQKYDGYLFQFEGGNIKLGRFSRVTEIGENYQEVAAELGTSLQEVEDLKKEINKVEKGYQQYLKNPASLGRGEQGAAGAASAVQPAVEAAAPAPEQAAGGWFSWVPDVSGYIPALFGGGTTPAPGPASGQ